MICQSADRIETLRLSTVLPPLLPGDLPAPSRLPPCPFIDVVLLEAARNVKRTAQLAA
jgi:hypothetical protein